MTDIQFFLQIETWISLVAAIATFATIVTIAFPYLHADKLAGRLNAVANHRELLKKKQMEELNAGRRPSLREQSSGFMNDFVRQFNLQQLLMTEQTKNKMAQAGLRGNRPLVTYLFFRIAAPPIFLVAALFYLFVIDPVEMERNMKILASLGAGVLGFYFPNIIVENIIQNRQKSITTAFPDALDLLLICVESGMSIEAAFNKVAEEVGSQSIELAEELSMTTAELSYLAERKQAYENLGKRTGIPAVKAVCLSLLQAERYGTRLGTALRVMAAENRELRMTAAEKKAAALPAQLTVPMILFFVPVLFVVILGPAGIKVMQMM